MLLLRYESNSNQTAILRWRLFTQDSSNSDNTDLLRLKICPSLTSRRRMEATASLVQRHSATTFTSSRCLHSSGLPSARERHCVIFSGSYYIVTGIWLSLVAKRKRHQDEWITECGLVFRDGCNELHWRCLASTFVSAICDEKCDITAAFVSGSRAGSTTRLYNRILEILFECQQRTYERTAVVRRPEDQGIETCIAVVTSMTDYQHPGRPVA
jgi:hypothetical protein